MAWTPSAAESAAAQRSWALLSGGRASIPAAELAPILQSSKLPSSLLYTIWSLSDPRNAGALAFEGWQLCLRLLSMGQASMEVSQEGLRVLARVVLPFPRIQLPAQALQPPPQPLAAAADDEFSDFSAAAPPPPQQQQEQLRAPTVTVADAFGSLLDEVPAPLGGKAAVVAPLGGMAAATAPLSSKAAVAATASPAAAIPSAGASEDLFGGFEAASALPSAPSQATSAMDFSLFDSPVVAAAAAAPQAQHSSPSPPPGTSAAAISLKRFSSGGASTAAAVVAPPKKPLPSASSHGSVGALSLSLGIGASALTPPPKASSPAVAGAAAAIPLASFLGLPATSPAAAAAAAAASVAVSTAATPSSAPPKSLPFIAPDFSSLRELPSLPRGRGGAIAAGEEDVLMYLSAMSNAVDVTQAQLLRPVEHLVQLTTPSAGAGARHPLPAPQLLRQCLTRLDSCDSILTRALLHLEGLPPLPNLRILVSEEAARISASLGSVELARAMVRSLITEGEEGSSASAGAHQASPSGAAPPALTSTSRTAGGKKAAPASAAPPRVLVMAPDSSFSSAAGAGAPHPAQAKVALRLPPPGGAPATSASAAAVSFPPPQGQPPQQQQVQPAPQPQLPQQQPEDDAFGDFLGTEEDTFGDFLGPSEGAAAAAAPPPLSGSLAMQMHGSAPLDLEPFADLLVVVEDAPLAGALSGARTSPSLSPHPPPVSRVAMVERESPLPDFAGGGQSGAALALAGGFLGSAAEDDEFGSFSSPSPRVPAVEVSQASAAAVSGLVAAGFPPSGVAYSSSPVFNGRGSTPRVPAAAFLALPTPPSNAPTHNPMRSNSTLNTSPLPLASSASPFSRLSPPAIGSSDSASSSSSNAGEAAESLAAPVPILVKASSLTSIASSPDLFAPTPSPSVSAAAMASFLSSSPSDEQEDLEFAEFSAPVEFPVPAPMPVAAAPPAGEGEEEEFADFETSVPVAAAAAAAPVSDLASMEAAFEAALPPTTSEDPPLAELLQPPPLQQPSPPPQTLPAVEAEGDAFAAFDAPLEVQELPSTAPSAAPVSVEVEEDEFGDFDDAAGASPLPSPPSLPPPSHADHVPPTSSSPPLALPHALRTLRAQACAAALARAAQRKNEAMQEDRLEDALALKHEIQALKAREAGSWGAQGPAPLPAAPLQPPLEQRLHGLLSPADVQAVLALAAAATAAAAPRTAAQSSPPLAGGLLSMDALARHDLPAAVSASLCLLRALACAQAMAPFQASLLAACEEGMGAASAGERALSAGLASVQKQAQQQGVERLQRLLCAAPRVQGMLASLTAFADLLRGIGEEGQPWLQLAAGGAGVGGNGAGAGAGSAAGTALAMAVEGSVRALRAFVVTARAALGSGAEAGGLQDLEAACQGLAAAWEARKGGLSGELEGTRAALAQWAGEGVQGAEEEARGREALEGLEGLLAAPEGASGGLTPAVARHPVLAALAAKRKALG